VIIDLLWWVPVEIMSLNVMELFSGAVAGLALVLFYLELKRFGRHPAIITFIPYVVVILIAAFRNLDLREGVEIVARYLSTFLLMFLVSAFMDTTRKRMRMFILFTATSVVPIVVSLYHLGTGSMEMELDGYNRLVGGYHNLHNHALMMLLFSCMGVFWLSYVRRVGTTFVFGLYTLGAMVCLYFSFVRNAQLGLVVFLVLFLVITKRHGMALVLVSGLVVAVTLSDTLQDRFDDLLLFFSDSTYESDRDWLGSGRWALWSVSFSEYVKYPLGDIFLGLGLGRHAVLTEPLYSAHYYDPRVGYIDPHNDYLSLMYQMGPTALVCYVVLQIQVIRHGLRLGRLGRTPWAREFGLFMVAMSGMVFVNNFLSNAFVSRVTLGWYFWGMAGLLFGESVETDEELEVREKAAAELALVEHRQKGREEAARRGATGYAPPPGMRRPPRSRFRFPLGFSRGPSGLKRRR